MSYLGGGGGGSGPSYRPGDGTARGRIPGDGEIICPKCAGNGGVSQTLPNGGSFTVCSMCHGHGVTKWPLNSEKCTALEKALDELVSAFEAEDNPGDGIIFDICDRVVTAYKAARHHDPT